jgi:DNA mismatch repair ATPase MutL
MHQDAHEFLNFLLNTIAELLQKELKRQKEESEKQATSSQQVFDLSNSTPLTPTPSTSTSTLTSNPTQTSTSNSNPTLATSSIPTTNNDKSPNVNTPLSQQSRPHFVKHYPDTIGGTFVHHIFEGILTNETKCLSCETVSLNLFSFFLIISFKEYNHVYLSRKKKKRHNII